MLFFVECYWTYHLRGRDAARAFARTMEVPGVDWGLLGSEEKSSWDSQRENWAYSRWWRSRTSPPSAATSSPA